MRGNYTDQNGKKFEVTNQDIENRIVYAFTDGVGQWYPESEYLTWRKSGDNSIGAIYEPEQVFIEPEKEIETIVPEETTQEAAEEVVVPEPVIEEPIVEEEVTPEVIEETIVEEIKEPEPEIKEEVIEKKQEPRKRNYKKKK